jgi:transposase
MLSLQRRDTNAEGKADAIARHLRRSDLPSGHPTKHAVRANQDARAAELLDASSHTASLHSPADCCHQLNPCPSCRVRDRRASRAQRCRAAARSGADVNDTRLPEIARACVAALGTQLLALKAQILAFDRRIMAWHRSNETSKRLDAIPGVGPALATALVASVSDPKAFRSGRGLPQPPPRQSKLAIHDRRRPRQAEKTIPSVRMTRATSTTPFR